MLLTLLLLAAIWAVGRYATEATRENGRPPAAGAEGGTAAGEAAAARARIDRSGGRTPAAPVTMYFVDGAAGGDVLQPVQVLLPAGRTPLRDVVNVWLNPPRDLHLETGVPPGTTGSVRLEGTTAVVDVSPDLYSRGQGGTHWANTVVYTLVYSLTELAAVDRVQLTVGGRPAELEGWVWSEPISRKDLPAGPDYFRLAPVIEYRP